MFTYFKIRFSTRSIISFNSILCLGRWLGATAPWLLEASKFPLGSIPQSFQDNPHLSQLRLEFCAGFIRSTAIQFYIDLALYIRCLVGGVLRQGLGDELGVQRGLHQSSK